MTAQIQKTTRRTSWAALAFYLFVAFEFFYMASPFAVYFYSVYRPGLNIMNQFPQAAWLVSFFLPHIVIQTASPWVNAHNLVGGVLAVGGFLAFCVGAAQVYYHKLARKGPVTGGIYNIIRHPQYAAFAMCSFGLLLIWARFIVLILFITVLFVYYFLARAEEKECEAKFGQPYLEYKKRTHMFLPFAIPFIDRLPALPEGRLARGFAIAGLYAVSVLMAVGLARGLQSLAIDSLYGVYTESTATISVGRIEMQKLEQVMAIAADESVQAHLVTAAADARFVNYVLPTSWYVAEVPMEVMPGSRGHAAPANYDPDLYKIIFVQVDLAPGQTAQGKEILVHTTTRTPIIEVWVDLAQGKVTRTLTPAVTANYENVPVPIY